MNFGLTDSARAMPTRWRWPPGELVGIAIGHVAVQSDQRQQLGDAIVNLVLRQDLVDAHRLTDDVADRHARIERREGILEDHLHLLAHREHFVAARLREVGALEQDLAVGRIVEAKHDAAERRFPAAGFADEAERLAGRDIERHLVDGPHQLLRLEETAADRKELRDALQLQDGAARSDLRRSDRLVRACGRLLELVEFHRPMARGAMALFHFDERRRDRAFIDREAAARSKPASLGRLEQVRRRAFDGLEPHGTATIEARHGAEKSARVWVSRIAEDILGCPAFDDPRGVHDVHAIRVARHDAEIVGDDHDRDAEPPREILHELEDLGLDRHVERCRRLVGDQQLGIAGEADRDHHALAHAARELMRILLQPALGIGDADQRQQLDGARLRDLSESCRGE